MYRVGGFDMTVIKGGMIVDGTGRPGFVGDVVVDGDKIVDVLQGGENSSTIETLNSQLSTL